MLRGRRYIYIRRIRRRTKTNEIKKKAINPKLPSVFRGTRACGYSTSPRARYIARNNGAFVRDIHTKIPGHISCRVVRVGDEIDVTPKQTFIYTYV